MIKIVFIVARDYNKSVFSVCSMDVDDDEPAFLEIPKTIPLLYEWARQQKMIYKQSATSKIACSHASMCSRVAAFHVETDMIGAFHAKAARSWHEATFLSEIGVAEHILFFDLDIYMADDTVWTMQHTIDTVAFLLSQLVPLVDEEDDLDTIICHVPPETVEKEGFDDQIKVGIHFYIPELYVDSATHLKLRSLLLDAATQKNPDKIGWSSDGAFEGSDLTVSWADVLDEGVCKSPRLRFAPSCKAASCFHSNEEKKTLGCKKGKSRHKVNVNRRYVFVDALRVNDGEIFSHMKHRKNFCDLDAPFTDGKAEQKLVKHRIEFLNLISLRKTGDVSNFTFPANFGEIQARADEMKGAEPGDAVDLQMVDIKAQQVELCTTLALCLGVVSSRSQVTSVKAIGKKAYITAYMIGLDQHMCFNHGQDHTSNRVYLTVRFVFFFFTFLFIFVVFFFVEFLFLGPTSVFRFFFFTLTFLFFVVLDFFPHLAARFVAISILGFDFFAFVDALYIDDALHGSSSIRFPIDFGLFLIDILFNRSIVGSWLR